MAIEDSNADKPTGGQPGDYFDTESRAQCANLVAHLVRNTDEMPFVCGPQGAGKTRFAARLGQLLEGEFRVVQVSAVGGDDLAIAIRGRLAIPEAEGDWIGRLLGADDGPRVLVLVDDAEQLGQLSQHAVLEMKQEGVPLVLVGGSPLPSVLVGEAREIDLPPLTETEARDYLAFLGRRAGVTVSAAAATRLHKTSGGWPGRLAEQLATGKAPKAPVKESRARPGGAGRWLLVVLVIVAAGLGLWFQQDINQLFEGPEPQLDSLTPEQPVAVPAPPQVVVEPVTESPSSQAEKQVAAETAVEPAAPEPVQEQPPAMPTGAPEQEVAETPPVPEPVVEAEPPVATKSEVKAPVQPEPAAIAQPPAPPPTPAEPAEQPTTAEAEAAHDGGLPWLRSQAAKAYTLQLLGAREPAAIRSFIDHHKLTGTYAIFERELAGKPWYSLVMGSFPDRASAVAAQDALPEGLNRKDVWPRTFGSIQELLDHP